MFVEMVVIIVENMSKCNSFFSGVSTMCWWYCVIAG